VRRPFPENEEMGGIALEHKLPVSGNFSGRSSRDGGFDSLDYRPSLHQQEKKGDSLSQLFEQKYHINRRVLFSFIALVLLQTLVGTLYKISQTGSHYAYSTFAAFSIAEFIKLAISLTLYTKERPNHESFKEALVATCVSLTKSGLVFKIAMLAALYFANNQLAFVLFLRADPASINLLKAGSSAITALVWCIFMGRVVSQEQWITIAMQVCGLIVVQYDACKGQTVLAASDYGLIFLSVLITATCGVWNEQQLKTMPLSLHEQNMVLYAFGALLNGAGHHVKANLDPHFPRFFEGYSALSVCVIIVNACFGVVVTAVYKYSNAIIKTLASAVTTVVLTVISMLFFGLHVTIVSGAGCVSVMLAVMLYTLTPSSDNGALLDVKTRTKIAVGAAAVLCALLRLIFL
jgi:hypothetical protein